MRAIVRRDLHDEDAGNYRWTDDEIDRHIAHAVKDLSEAVPDEQKATEATTAGARGIDISDIADRVMVEAVEYPVDQFPVRYQRFAVWGNVLTLLGDEVPDGSNAHIYYGKLHRLDESTSTIPERLEDLVAIGAAGYAAIEWAQYAANRVNVGGTTTPADLLKWGQGRLAQFKEQLKRAGRRHRVRVRSLYRPYLSPVSKSTDYGP
jgi:hypothetical protein